MRRTISPHALIPLTLLLLACDGEGGGSDTDEDTNSDTTEETDDGGGETDDKETDDGGDDTDADTDTDTGEAGPVLPDCASTCSPSATPFGGGDGSGAAPYQICSEAQFLAIEDSGSSDFELCSDLDFSGESAPIITELSGTFEGHGLAIRNLEWNLAASGSFALFNTMSGTLRGLRLLDVDIDGNNRFAAAVNNLPSGGLVQDVHVTGTVVGYASFAGVVRAASPGSTLEDVSFDGTLTQNGTFTVGGGYAGGITSLLRGTGTRLEVRGTITGQGGRIGGITDELGADATLSQSISRADVTGGGTVGGLVGIGTGTIEDCYVTGSVNGTGSPVAGMVGGGATSITHSYVAATFSTTATEDPHAIASSNSTLLDGVVYDSTLADGVDDSSGSPDPTALPTASMEDPTNAAFDDWSDTGWVHVAGDLPRLAWE